MNGKGQAELPDTADHRRRSGRLHEEDAGQRDDLDDHGKVKGGYPIVNYEYAIVNSTAVELEHRQGHPLGPRVGDQRQGRERATYLSQVNFQPLPAKIVAASLKQIKSIQ